MPLSRHVNEVVVAIAAEMMMVMVFVSSAFVSVLVAVGGLEWGGSESAIERYTVAYWPPRELLGRKTGGPGFQGTGLPQK